MSTPATDTVAVACIGDDNRAMPMAVTLFSALKNLRPGATLSLSLFDAGMSAENRHRVERTLLSAGRPFQTRWITADMAAFGDLGTNTWVNRSVFLKLTIPDSVPADLARVIYLDTDLVVLRSLTEPWEQEMANYAVLAARDYTIPYLSSPQGVRDATRLALGLHPEIPYFSAGVLVLNLTHWRRENTAARVLDYLREYQGRTNMDEQEGLNAVIGGRWGELDPRWNVQVSAASTYDAWTPSPYKEAMRGRIKEIRRDPYILHFAGVPKPWEAGAMSAEGQQFVRYLKESRWYTPAEYRRWRADFLTRAVARKLRALTGRR